MRELFHGLTIVDHQTDVHRNIVSLRVSENLFDDLSDSPEAWQAAIALELATKPHTHTSSQPVIARPFEEADYNQAIDYPFRNWSASRYSNGAFGVWYGADSLATSIYETIHHWRAGLLRDAGWQDVEGVQIERKVYVVRCEAALLDFRAKVGAYPALIDPDSYHFTHQVGARIHRDGHPGLITPSARCAGDVVAIFNQPVLSNPRQACYLTYRVDAGKTTVTRQPNDVVLHV